MKQLQGFTEPNFTLFTIPDLEHRMAAIRTQIQPQFAAMGEQVEIFLSNTVGTPFHTHIAKHARRTKNPPEETWVAWSAQKRGYKAHPHFQLGICESHIFIWFALIYEYEKKQEFAKKVSEHPEIWAQMPSSFYLSSDHTDSELNNLLPINEQSCSSVLQRLESVKKAEFLCGTFLGREEAMSYDGPKLVQHVKNVYQELLPLYKLSIDL